MSRFWCHKIGSDQVWLNRGWFEDKIYKIRTRCPLIFWVKQWKVLQNRVELEIKKLDAICVYFSHYSVNFERNLKNQIICTVEMKFVCRIDWSKEGAQHQPFAPLKSGKYAKTLRKWDDLNTMSFIDHWSKSGPHLKSCTSFSYEQEACFSERRCNQSCRQAFLSVMGLWITIPLADIGGPPEIWWSLGEWTDQAPAICVFVPICLFQVSE